ncbi:FAD-dependent oxidoreductase [Candidatus Uhrbacteria bacterium]|nr:FAD-dependent oxidoreductase [Candidatus Uhrbacteria bacterium]
MTDSTMQTQGQPAVLQMRPFTVEELKWETPNTFTLVLVPEAGVEMIQFKPGQWVYMHLLNQDGSSWARAAFSIATSPEESTQKLELGVKIYGDYTKRASHLIPGDRVMLQGPFGVFTLHEGVTPLVMFAGGIGITPFRGMIRALAQQKSSTQVILFYSNKRVEDIAYFDDLRRIDEAWPGLTLVHTLTEHAPSGWDGEIGRLDGAMLKRHYADFDRGEFLMCGPPEFMKVIEGLLAAEGVDTKKRLRKELFG